MLIFYSSVTLDEGFDILARESKHDRMVGGACVARASGWSLFQNHHQRGEKIRCWNCQLTADRWVVTKGATDLIGLPVMNLFAGHHMMTRDHIIPKSLGGVDAVRNLRGACEECNRQRSNEISPDDIAFARNNPDLIDPVRVRKGIELLNKMVGKMVEYGASKEEIEKKMKPWKDMDYI